MLYLAKELNYIDNPKVKSLSDKSVEISKAISGFIKALK